MRLPSLLHITCNLVDSAINCLQCQKTEMHTSKVKPSVRMARHSTMAFPMQMVFLVIISSYYLIAFVFLKPKGCVMYEVLCGCVSL